MMQEERVSEISYLNMLIIACAAAIPIALLVVAYFAIVDGGQIILWERIPAALHQIDIRIYTVLLATLGGLAAGLVLKYLGIHNEKSLTEEITAEGKVEYRGLFGLIVAAIIGLACDASLGPESPLGHMGGGLNSWLADRLKYSVERRRVLALSGISTVFGGFLGTPLGGAFIAIEYTGLIRFPLYPDIIAGMSTALIGYLISRGILGKSYFGYFQFTDQAGFEPIHLIYALMFGALSVVLGYLFMALFRGLKAATAPLSSHPVLKITLGGLGFGLVGALLPLTLFSGGPQLKRSSNRARRSGLG
jgi:H+/Cl- antiporter ClcA